MVGTIAGIGTLSASPLVIANSAALTAGVGSAAGNLTSYALAVGAAAGSGSAGSYLNGAVANAAGTSQAIGVTYLFLSDAEIICIHEEIRTIQVSFENREAIVAHEDRVYEVSEDYRSGGSKNRKRIC